MTKTLKPVLALSIAALTLLAGCAKSEATTGFNAIKKAMADDKVEVKKVTHCEFIHYDLNKAAKEEKDDKVADTYREMGNEVTYLYTFEDKSGKEFTATGEYSVKDKKAEYAVLVVGDDLAKAAWNLAVKDADSHDYVTTGVLVK